MKPLSKIKRLKKSVGKSIKASPIRLLINLRAVREGANVSLRDAAKELGIGHATLARIEWGNTPEMETALKAAAFYEKRVDEIWGLK